ncbi:c-type cytochrome [Primorskyibacter sp. 2E107]|uniref:c-type cytochrome n=1 Tax=Primorskyibacter sp. 2E107 TaxID=3403458 RepID=UPI003AF66A4C
MNKNVVAMVALISSSTAAFAESHASGDPAEGEKVFRQCRSCHMIQDADGNDIQKGGQVGPNLYGVAGRTAGSVDDFRYSDAMVAAGEAGLAWDEEHFVPYVQDATGFLREYLDDSSARGKMTYRVRKEEDAINVWAYLVSVGSE